MKIRISWIRPLALLLLLLATGIQGFGQKGEIPKAIISGDVKNQLSEENLAGITVELYCDGNLVESKTTGSNGKFKFNAVDIEKKYKVVFKSASHVSRFVDIDLTGIPPEDTYKKWDLVLPMKIIERLPNIDFSTLEPRRSTIMKYNKSAGEIDFNMGEIETYKKELEKLLKKVEAEKAKQDAEKQAQEKKYTEALAAAEDAMKKKDYQAAINKYQEAKAAKPGEAANLDKKLEVANQEYKKFQGDQALEKEYQEFMKAGDDKLKAGDFDNAIASYKQALGKKPNDAPANQKIKDAETAKKSGVDKQYTDLLARADKSFKEKDYAQAKTYYKEAGDIKPTESLPKQKITEIDDLIKKGMESETKYNEYIANANKALVSNKYEEAITNFNEALKVRPADPEATTGLANAKKAKETADKEVASQAAKKKEFEALVLAGDKEFTAKNYAAAIQKYDEALAKMDDPAIKKKKFDAEAAQKKLDEENALKTAAEQKKKEYEGLMAEGNTAFTAKNFDEAITKYKAAVATGVNTLEAQKKLIEAEAAKAAAAKAEADKLAADKKKTEFDALISAGDTKLGAKEFDNALAEYNKALLLKIDDAAANKKIADAKTAKAAYDKEIADNKLKDAEAKKKAEFDAFLAAGDTKLSAKEFDNAIAEYNKALLLKVDDAAANKKIVEVKAAKAAYDKEIADNKLKDAEAKKKTDFDAFLAAGDTKLGAKEFDNALAEYNKALLLKVDDAAANKKIADAKTAKAAYDKEIADNKLKDAEAKKKAEFDGFIAAGDTKLGAKEFDKAIAEYNKALLLKLDDAAANAKIKEATEAKVAFEKEKADKLASEADAAQKKKLYDETILKAQKDYDAGEFKAAIEKYNIALTYKPDDTFAKGQIDKANAELDKKAKFAEEQLQKLLDVADKEFTAGNYADSKGYYERYLKQRPDHAHSQGRIKEIDEKIKEQTANAANAKKKSEFDALIAAGDTKLGTKEFDKAIAEYNKALLTKFDDAAANNKIKEATEAKIAYDKEIADKLKNEADAKKKAEFDSFIAAGDTKLGTKEFDKAIAEYNKALLTKFDDAIANNKIKEATEAKIAYDKEMADKLKNEADAKKKADFDGFISAGDSKLGTKEFDKAIAEYSKALLTKFDDATANSKIKEATEAKTAYDKEMADNKLKDAEAKKKADFDAFIAAGNSKVDAKDFDKGMDEYKKALALKVDDATANQKIADAVAAKEQWLKDQLAQADKAKNKKLYEETIAKAQKDFDAGEFQAAIDKYNTALTYAPDDAFAKGQIEKANQKLKEKQDFAEQQLQKLLEAADKDFAAGNYLDAKGYYERYVKQRPDNTYAQGRIKECDDKIKEANANAAAQAQTEAKYKDFMTKGETAFKAKKYDDAIAMYDGALGVKAGDATATDKKDQVMRAKQDAASAAENAVAKQKYDAAIKKANAKFDGGEFKASIDDYNEALTHIPNDKFATDRIALANERMNTKAKEAEEMLNKLLMAADNEFNDKNWSDAKGYYERYLKLKPDNTYAQGRLKECEENLKAELANAANKQALEAKYKKYMDDGDKAAGAKSYDDAIKQFTSALDIKPGDATAQKRIDDMNKLKNDLFKLASQQKNAKENQAKYEAAIAEGNAQLSSSNFDPAIASYKEALGYKPEDKYATEQIKRCIKLKAQKQSELDAMYNAIIKKADEMFDAKNYGEAKTYYERARDKRGTDPYPPQRIEECDKILSKIANANKGYTLEHNGAIVTDQTLLEGQKLLEEAKRQEKYQAEQAYVEINNKQQQFISEKSADQLNNTLSQQDQFNKDQFDRSRGFEEKDAMRWQKIDSTREFMDNREQAYYNKTEQDELAGYNRQQKFNQDQFDSENMFKDKDKMREYKADSMKFYKDYKENMESQMNKNHVEENYNLQASNNNDAYNREQMYKAKDGMREYKADSVKFYKDYKENMESQMNKNHVEENYNLQASNNNDAYNREQMYKAKDGMREYKADSMKFYKDYKESMESQMNKNHVKENYDLQASNNTDAYNREQMYKEKDGMREYKADSMKFYKDYKESLESQMNKNHVKENYDLQASNNNEAYNREQMYKEKDGMREYKADSVKFYKDVKEKAESEANKNHVKENYDLQASNNTDAYNREQMFKEKDGMREYKADSVKFYKDIKEKAESEANKNHVKENYDLQANNNNDAFKREQMYKDKDNEIRGETVKKTQAVLDNNTNNLREYSKDGAEQVKENNEKFKTTSPVVPKNYDNGHLAQLAVDYGAGVHQWTTNKYNGNKVVTEIIVRRIAVKGNTANDYMMTQSRWGVSYTKNGQTIGEHVWNIETGGNLIIHDK